MVLCKYFQQGCCRYGPSCRFEHVYASKYNYQATPPAQTASAGTGSGLPDEQLIIQVQQDAQAVLKSGQWLLSCYTPFKEKQLFPGFSDLSPEEARLFIYEAKASNTLDQAVNYMNNLVKETKYKYELLMKPTPEIIQVLRTLYRGEPAKNPFQTAQNIFKNASNNAASIFRSAVQQTSPGPNTMPSLFGQPQNATPKSIFAQANQSIFGSSQAHSTLAPQVTDNLAAKSLFAQANQNVFGSNASQQQSQNTFASAQPNIFQQQQQPSSHHSLTNVFTNPHTTNIFGKQALAENHSDDSRIYSKLEELTEEDLEHYKSPNFKLGFIPEVPPPHSLCV